jgi:methyltransferase (TIGR00027 family)
VESSDFDAVSETAIGAAMMRARESLRPDRLFDDPYAQVFVDAAPTAFAQEPLDADAEGLAALEAAFALDVAIRTRFYDDYLRAECSAGSRQVVLLAAGLDARAFRLDWPADVRLFELDLPPVFRFKEPALARRGAAPRCVRTVVPVDLRDDWAAVLTDSGFETNRRTAWTAEGLLAYLSDGDSVRLLNSVRDLSAPGSHLALENASIGDDSLLTEAGSLPGMDHVTSLWRGGLSESAPAWLSQNGWRVQIHDRPSVAASYGRRAPGGLTGGFVNAELHDDR